VNKDLPVTGDNLTLFLIYNFTHTYMCSISRCKLKGKKSYLQGNGLKSLKNPKPSNGGNTGALYATHRPVATPSAAAQASPTAGDAYISMMGTPRRTPRPRFSISVRAIRLDLSADRLATDRDRNNRPVGAQNLPTERCNGLDLRQAKSCNT
jgi:hypothetical protein